MTNEKLKPNKFGAYFSPNSIKTPLARACWPKLDKPSSYEGGEPKYSVHLLFDKTKKAELKKFHTEVKAFEANLLKLNKQIKYNIFRDADEEFLNDEGEVRYQYVKNTYFIKATNKKPITIKAPNAKDNLESNLIQGGVLVYAVVTPGYGKDGFFYQLKVVQLASDDGVRFGGGGDGSDLLEVLEEGDDFSTSTTVSDDFEEETPAPKAVAKAPVAKAPLKKAEVVEEDEDLIDF